MKIFMSIIMILLFSSTGQAMELRDPEAYKAKDVQTYLNGDGGDSRIASGVCIGPFKELVNDNGTKIGSVLSTCALMAFRPGADTDVAVPLMGIMLYDVAGLSFTVAIDPFGGKTFYGFGISILELAGILGSEEDEKKTIGPSPTAFLPISFHGLKTR